MFVDLYAIQNVPPSNINRDDTGSPKTAMYGGALRARVSSQAWKRAMRKMFEGLLPKESLGIRTKLAAGLIVDSISSKRDDLSERAAELAEAVLKAAGLKVSASKRKGDTEGAASTDYLVFIAQRELDELADLAIEWSDADKDLSKVDKSMKSEVSKVFHGVQAVDIALFGRMLADAPDLNTDASCQVAHAISVDRVSPEYDYFTAVDDCASDDNAGAGMIGTVEFNSSTLYRYATISIEALMNQLGDVTATAEGVRAFAEAFVRSMPTGKQNTFANRTLPGTFVVAVRPTQPVNLVSAFENPVRPSASRSISSLAEDLLADEMLTVEKAYGDKPVAAWFVSTVSSEKKLNQVAESASLEELLSELSTTVESLLDRGGE